MKRKTKIVNKYELSEELLKKVSGGNGAPDYTPHAAFTCPVCRKQHTFSILLDLSIDGLYGKIDNVDDTCYDIITIGNVSLNLDGTGTADMATRQGPSYTVQFTIIR
ncbi:MAG: hypothetical protein J5922_00760 [Clostridia bacterium]|nr:hypothetical protein [Clostridia bacterium]